jgi:hypothetical protein
MDRIRVLLGELLDLHAAPPGGDHADALQFAIQDEAQVQLALERLGHFDVNALAGLALRSGLAGHQALSKQILGGLRDFVVGPAQLDTAGLAATAGMHLGLDRPVPAAQLGSHENRLVRAVGDATARHRNPEP